MSFLVSHLPVLMSFFVSGLKAKQKTKNRKNIEKIFVFFVGGFDFGKVSHVIFSLMSFWWIIISQLMSNWWSFLKCNIDKPNLKKNETTNWKEVHFELLGCQDPYTLWIYMNWQVPFSRCFKWMSMSYWCRFVALFFYSRSMSNRSTIDGKMIVKQRRNPNRPLLPRQAPDWRDLGVLPEWVLSSWIIK